MVKRTERGWPGHFICASRCEFRRNTLLDFGRKKIIISTVGRMLHEDYGKITETPIGADDRYYETMAFAAKKDGSYWDINIGKQLSFKSPWAICAKSVDELSYDGDNRANAMHEAVVLEFIAHQSSVKKGEEVTKCILRGD